MGDPHPNREALARFAEGELPSDEARRIDQHLGVCAECRELVEEIALADRLDLLDALLFPGYDQAFERAVVGAADCLESLSAERSAAEELLSDLLHDPPALRRQRAFTEEKFHSLKLCQLLQARSRDHWFSNPFAALEWAELAAVVAHSLDPGRYGSNMVEDARALSWAYTGNAHRITSDLWRAEQSLRQAWLHHYQAGEDVTTETELLSITSSLRIWQSRYEDAARFSDRAIALYREGQERHAEGAALLQKGLTLLFQDRFQEAIQTTRLGLTLIDPTDLQLQLTGKHNLIACHFQEKAPDEAMSLLQGSLGLYEEVGGSVALARLRWIEGKFLASTGRLGEAKRSFSTARDILIERQTGLEVFQISLDLAYVLLREGRQRHVRDLLQDIIPLGERVGGSPQEILLARWFYAQASRG